MADYDIRPLQLRILEVLKTFHKVCERHKLRYYVTAGTLLGAVRHGGFIPWDDDLDIAMPRPDYDRLITNADRWLPYPLELVCAERNNDYPLPFAKLQDASTTLIERPHLPFLGGIYIDIFPLDGVSGNHLARRLHFIRHEYYKRALYFLCRDPYKHGRGPSSWLPLMARSLYSLKGLQQLMRKEMSDMDYESSDYVVDHDDGLKGVLDKTIIGNPTPLRFEDTIVWSYSDPHKYLKQKYGDDYLLPPPAAKRRQHNFFLLDLDKPYRNYRDENC